MPMPRIVHAAFGGDVHAITILRTIMVEASRYDAVVQGQAAELLTHELIHVDQWLRYGWFGFLSRYVRDYVGLRLLGVDHNVAYRGITFEFAAYAASDRIVRDAS